MALIKCPECGKDVSDTAIMCPNCGFGVSEKMKKQESSENISTKKLTSVKGIFNLKSKSKIIIAISCGAIFIAVFLFILSNKNNQIERLKLGMSFEEVKNILGKADISRERGSYHDESYEKEYYLGIEGTIHVNYYDGKVNVLTWVSEYNDKYESFSEKILKHFQEEYGKPKKCDVSSHHHWDINENLSVNVIPDDYFKQILISYNSYNLCD